MAISKRIGEIVNPLLVCQFSFILSFMLVFEGNSPLRQLIGDGESLNLPLWSNGAQAVVALLLVVAYVLHPQRPYERRFCLFGCALSVLGAAGFIAACCGSVPTWLVNASCAVFGLGCLLLITVWGGWYARFDAWKALFNSALGHLISGVLLWGATLLPASLGPLELGASVLFTCGAVAGGLRETRKNPSSIVAPDTAETGTQTARSFARTLGPLAIPVVGVMLYAMGTGLLNGVHADDASLFFIAPAITMVIVLALTLFVRRANISFTLCYVAFPVIAVATLLVQVLSAYIDIPQLEGLSFLLLNFAEVLLWAMLSTVVAGGGLNAVVAFCGLKLLSSTATLLGVLVASFTDVVDIAMSVFLTLYLIAVLLTAYPIIRNTRLETGSSAAGDTGRKADGKSRSAGKAGDVQASLGGAASPNRTEPGSVATHPEGSSRLEEAALRAGLTPRETEVFMFLARGYGSPYISKCLVITDNTVRSHMKSIYRKFGVNSREELIDLVS